MTPELVFLGTPEAAVPTLEAVAGVHDVTLVVTQPDRPRGRSGTPAPPPVKTAAQRLGIPVAQPESKTELQETLADATPFDVGIVVAYGRILSPEVLTLPTHGFLNVHFSLLPRWRGAAPVARALMAGDTMTGVTIIRLDEGLDTGPVLTAQGVDIRSDDDAGRLTDRLAGLGARLLASSVVHYVEGGLIPVTQSDEGATYAGKIERSDRPISTGSTVADIVGQVRGLSPEPAATLDIDGQTHKVLAVRPAPAGPTPGRWELVGAIPVVGLADGWIELVELQPPGKRPQTGEEWARGHRPDGGVVR